MIAPAHWSLAAVLTWLGPAPTQGPASRAEQFPGEPGSGVALDAPLHGGHPRKLARPKPFVPADPDEVASLEVMEQLVERFEAGAEAMGHSTATFLAIDAERGKRVIARAYDDRIAVHRDKARVLRLAAIKRYEEFIQRRPDDATWTPEVMYRLAGLQVEESNERLAEAEETFQRELEAYQLKVAKNPEAPPPVAPQPDHGQAIAAYQRVVRGFPRFHMGDGALYMMGTLFAEMEDEEASRQSYLALACANRFKPPLGGEDGQGAETLPFGAGAYAECTPWKAGSGFAPEAWLRIGESHYEGDEFEPALEAYAQVADDPEADLYDEALLRMAWTLYLMRRFPEAATRFDEFIRYADAHRDQKDEGGALGLRDDAVRYLAKTYIEEDWDLDGRRDALVGLTRLDRDYASRGGERHVPEVYAALGDLLAEQTLYLQSIEIWKLALERWPLAAAAPSIQSRVFEAYTLMQETDAGNEARDRLATQYLRGTPWFAANEADPEAIEEALKLAEGALVATALDHHARAQALRAEGRADDAKREYEIAATAYSAYLERFPDTPSSYEYRFNAADAMYFAGKFVDAAKQYALVRDSNLDDKFQEEAANGVILALEGYIDDASVAGRLKVRDMPAEGMEGTFDAPLEIPKALLALQEAYDRFVQLRPKSEQVGTMKYLAGTIAQKYWHFDDAEQRFSEVLEDHCDENVSINAGMAILSAKVVQSKLDEAKAWTEKLAASGCGEGEEAAKFAGQLTTMGNAVRFKEATILYDAGEFEAAADRYVALVNEAPADPNADRALNNAAVAYENIGRFASASQTYQRIYTQYPDSEFADDALLRTGFNHSRFFEFEDAVKSYLILAEDQRYKDSEHREIALWNAADLLDSLQEYRRSAEMFERFAAKSTDETKAADAAFRAAEVTAKLRSSKDTIRAYETFLGRYGKDGAQASRIVEAHLRIGQAHEDQQQRARAEQYYQMAVSQFESRGLKPATDAADFPSQAQFLLAEYALRDVLETKITSTGKKMESEVQALTDRLLAASTAYDKVFPYRRIDWVLAAMYRRGYAFETWAINIRAAPVPRQLKEYSEAWFAYKDIVETHAARAEEKAIALYEQTVQRSKEFNIANDWTRAAKERLNIYKPDAYPLLRPPALDLQLEDFR